MAEGVEILISADDQASKVLGNVADNVDVKVKRIREVGGRAKASTEFIGTLSKTLGGSELANYAGSLGQLTEKMSAFSEVSKAGGAGALAFKAGIAAVVAVGAFKLGEAIGNAVFETKRWKEELAAAEKEATRLEAAILKATSRTFGIEKQEIELLDAGQQEVAVKELMDRLEKEILGKREQIRAKLETGEDMMTAWLGSPEDRKKAVDVSAEEAAIEQLRAQIEELRFDNSERAKGIELRKKENALKTSNENYLKGLQQEVELLRASKQEHAAIEAIQKTGGDAVAAGKAEALIREKDALLAKAEAEKEAEAAAKKSAEDQQRNAEKLASLKKSELAKLEEQRILLTEGKEAAHAFALEQQGIDKAMAKRIATEKSMLDRQAEKVTEQAPQQAMQGRLLTRGTSDDIRKRQLDAALKMYEALQAIKENTKEFKSTTELAFEVVGRS